MEGSETKERPPMPGFEHWGDDHPAKRNTFVSVARMDHESTIERSADNHNIALCYAAADGHLNAVQSALVGGKLLALDDTVDEGFLITDKPVGDLPYKIDWADNNSDGDTAAHYAAYAGSRPILELLFQKGWNPDAKNLTMTSVRQTASDYGQNEALALWIGKRVSQARRKEEAEESLESSQQSTLADSQTNIEHYKLEGEKQRENAFDLVNLDSDKALQVENEWKKGSSVYFRLSTTDVIQTQQVTSCFFNATERDLMQERIEALEQEKKQLEAYITDKLGALQDQFKQIVVNIQEKQREELGTFMESLNFPASPNSSSPKQIYKK
jgi:hypothetical protein